MTAGRTYEAFEVEDFSSMDDLANVLREIDQDDARYNRSLGAMERGLDGVVCVAARGEGEPQGLVTAGHGKT